MDVVWALDSQSRGAFCLRNLGRCPLTRTGKVEGFQVQLKAEVRPPKAANVHSYSGREISAAPGNDRIYGRSRHIGTEVESTPGMPGFRGSRAAGSQRGSRVRWRLCT